MNSLISNAQIHQQHQQQFLIQLQQQQQQFLLQQQQQFLLQQQQQQPQNEQQQPQEHPPQEQQLHAQQPHEQQQQQQSSTHQPLFSLFDHPFSIPSEVSSYLGLLQNDDPDTNTITTLNHQKKLPSRAKNLAMAVFLGIKDAFPSDVLLKSTLTAKGKLGQLDVHKVNFIKQKTLVQLGATRQDWFICQPRLKELLREHRKKLSKMSKMS